jgi:hypothetical protein
VIYDFVYFVNTFLYLICDLKNCNLIIQPCPNNKTPPSSLFFFLFELLKKIAMAAGGGIPDRQDFGKSISLENRGGIQYVKHTKHPVFETK